MAACEGELTSLRGQTVLFTGTFRLDGQRVTRATLTTFAKAYGAEVVTDESHKVTVLIVGEAWTGPLHDERRRYSKKASFVEGVEHKTGRHVYVIDSVGFAALLKGCSARCFELRPPVWR